MKIEREIVCVRGAGDLATGVIQKFVRSGAWVYALEIENPTAIRRQVALSTAMETGEFRVEDILAKKVEFSTRNLKECWEKGIVPIVEDETGWTVKEVKPVAMIDAILAKRNLGTYREMAPITIGLGPGFLAPDEVDVVIETMRGHSLGKMISNGSALPNTGSPGEIGGQSVLRVLHSPEAGKIKHLTTIGSRLEAEEPMFQVGNTIVRAPFTGTVRGLISEKIEVKKGMKVADIDPRVLSENEIFEISDKARCLGGAALEAYLYLRRQKGL